MATAAEAIEEMAKATGIPPVNLEWAAINLRKDRRNGWPIGGRGGGKNAPRPKVPHLVNLALASLVLEPRNETADLVMRYRKMVPDKESRLVMLWRFGPDPDDWAKSEEIVSSLIEILCPGDTLGDMLESLVRRLMSTDQPLARAERRAFAREHLRSLTVRRFRFAGGAIGASLEFIDGNQVFNQVFREISPGLVPPMTEDAPENPDIPPAAYWDLSSMPYKLFEIMADLALDTERELGQSASSDTASRTAAKDVETTTPATVGTEPAPVDKASHPGANPVNSADISNQQDSDENKRGQCPPPFSPHGSPSSDHSNQRRDDPPWPSLDSPLRSAG
jgi:hypothetical protein